MHDGLVIPMAILHYISLRLHSLEGEIQSKRSVVLLGRSNIPHCREGHGSPQELRVGLGWQPG